MFSRFLILLRKSDWLMYSLILLLLCLSLLAIYSTTMGEGGAKETFTKQLIFVMVGLVLMLAVSLIDYRQIRVFSNVMFIFGLLLLGLVLIFGRTIRGTTGWIFLGSYGFQPVEFVKLCLLVFLSKYFARYGQEIHLAHHLIRSGLLTFLYLVLVLLEPDLGSALIYFIIWLGLMLLMNIKRSYLVAVLLIIIICFSLGWAFGLEPYQKERVITFLNPERDPLATGYNVRQAIVAVGSGQFLGRGLGLGTQSQLQFLPEQQTDFIFAVIGEELGLIGTTFALALFIMLFLRLLRQAKRSRDDYALFFISGTIIMIFFQTLVNIAMNLGFAPVIGIPLPFLSAGGSALLTNLIAIGMVQSIVVHRSSA